MAENLNLETFLYISPIEFRINLLDKNSSKNFYKNELKFEKNSKFIDLYQLSKFLEENIFKIEKLIGKFIENIFLIIDSNEVINLSLGIKKKNYTKIINKKYFEILITEAKDIIKEKYNDYKIMHILIDKFLINGNSHIKLKKDFNGEDFGLEIQFIIVPNFYTTKIEEVLKKFQIKVVGYINGKYIKNLIKDKNTDFSQMAQMIQKGYNENEVMIKSKNIKNMGFFEKFFQLFS